MRLTTRGVQTSREYAAGAAPLPRPGDAILISLNGLAGFALAGDKGFAHLAGDHVLLGGALSIGSPRS